MILKECYLTVKMVLRRMFCNEHKCMIYIALKMVNFFLGQLGGYVKYPNPCFLCLRDSRASEACAARLCSHTFSMGLNPETSMALIWAVVGDGIAPHVSAKESSHFHLVFPFLLASAILACM